MSAALASLQGLSVRDLIDQNARQSPDAVFAIDPKSGEELTYASLKKSAESVAGYLSKRGIAPGDSVAFAMANGLDTVQVVLGILYGGFLATAVNLVSGQKTISYVLQHSSAKLVFCQEKTKPLLEQAAGSKAPTIFHVVHKDLFHGPANEDAGASVGESEDGLLMYTSGTTGVPKGVVLTHGNLIAGGANTALAHELTANDRGLCVLPLYHINGLCVTVLGALVSGGCVIVPEKFSVSQFWQQIRDCRGTWFSVVPTQISYLLHEADTAGHDRAGLEQVRFGRSASAPLSPDVQQAFQTRFELPIIETMGLTETAAQILSNPMQGTRKIGSPGIAYGNEVVIADDNQKPCAAGTEGEVLVRGPNVMRCYRNNEEATNAALTPDGWLRTGDLGKMDEDGYVYITGRLKELIIKGGENIAPREIDEALYTHPDVVEAAAFAKSCPRYGQKVEAGVRVCEGSGLTETALLDLCRDKVGEFKCPDRVYFLPELPKGPSGKIQRIKLAEMTA